MCFRVDSVFWAGIMVARVRRRWDDDTHFLFKGESRSVHSCLHDIVCHLTYL